MFIKTAAFYGKSVAGALLVAGILATPTSGQSTSPLLGISAVKHERIAVIRNEDGSLKLGRRNSVQSTNWSGYVLSNYVTGQTYTSASVSWTVPKVTYQAPPPTCHMVQGKHGAAAQQVCFSQNVDVEYSSSWVGIGGNCENTNCTRADSTLIQLGTEQDAASDGTTQYYAWYEMLPADSVTITTTPAATSTTSKFCRHGSCAAPSPPQPVQPGDAMTASLVCQANCEAGQNQTWLLTMADTTQKWTFSTTVTYKSTFASVEWIQEAPTSNSVLPLADFTPTTFNPTDDGKNPGIANATNGTVGPDAITMVDPYGETSEPSPVTGLDVFSTCWGNNPNSIAACPAP